MHQDEDFKKRIRKSMRMVKVLFGMIFIILGGMVFYKIDPNFFDFDPKAEAIVEVDRDLIENGIHVRTGLIDAEGMFLVVNNCTNCHSAKLVTQNRMDADGWNNTIKWMQETQNLWDLGENQEVIVDYLIKNYPPKISNGRRNNLIDIDWYVLED